MTLSPIDDSADKEKSPVIMVIVHPWHWTIAALLFSGSAVILCTVERRYRRSGDLSSLQVFFPNYQKFFVTKSIKYTAFSYNVVLKGKIAR